MRGASSTALPEMSEISRSAGVPPIKTATLPKSAHAAISEVLFAPNFKPLRSIRVFTILQPGTWPISISSSLALELFGLTMKFACFFFRDTGAAQGESLQTGFIDEARGMVAGRIAEH